jgi:hypothetical protein
VDGSCAPVSRSSLIGGRAHGPDELIDGGVAVGVRDDLPAVGETCPDLGQGDFIGQGLISAVVLSRPSGTSV